MHPLNLTQMTLRHKIGSGLEGPAYDLSRVLNRNLGLAFRSKFVAHLNNLFCCAYASLVLGGKQGVREQSQRKIFILINISFWTQVTIL